MPVLAMRAQRATGAAATRRVAADRVLPAAVAAIFLLPLLGMLLGSLQPPGAAATSGVGVLPEDPTLGSYRRLAELLPLATFVRNSLLVSLVAVPLTVVVSSLAGFGIRLLDPRLRRAVVLASLVVLLIPASALWTSRLQVYDALRLTGSLLPLMAPALMGTTPLYALLYAWAYGRVRDAQLHAARLEGETTLSTWWRLAMPQVRPATSAVTVLAFAFHWGNFMDALLYLGSVADYTVPIGLDSLKLLRPTEFGILLAGAVIFTLPSLLVFSGALRLFDDDPLHALRKDPTR